LKFYITPVGNDNSTVYSVYISYKNGDELPLGDPDKLLAAFTYREDAEAYKARKEKEYKC